MQREVKGLNPDNNQRPDVQIVFPGRMILTDVAVSHTLTAYHIGHASSSAGKKQYAKDKKYADVAARLGAELLNFSVESSGGMASSAVRLVKVIGEEGERWSAGTWNSGLVERELLASVAVAVQRGNALSMLCGLTRAASKRASRCNDESGDGREADH